MRITNEYVKSFNPCTDRFDNYVKHYPNSDLSIVEFLKLENITYEDKIWVWKNLATINEAAIFGLKCAEGVLNIFEKEYPADDRPRKAIEAARLYIKEPTKENKEAAAGQNQNICQAV